jgi:hypothetical protein
MHDPLTQLRAEVARTEAMLHGLRTALAFFEVPPADKPSPVVTPRKAQLLAVVEDIPGKAPESAVVDSLDSAEPIIGRLVKCCPKCKETKNITEFGKNGSASDGLQTYCKRCKSLIQADYYKSTKPDQSPPPVTKPRQGMDFSEDNIEPGDHVGKARTW